MPVDIESILIDCWGYLHPVSTVFLTDGRHVDWDLRTGEMFLQLPDGQVDIWTPGDKSADHRANAETWSVVREYARRHGKHLCRGIMRAMRYQLPDNCAWRDALEYERWNY